MAAGIHFVMISNFRHTYLILRCIVSVAYEICKISRNGIKGLKDDQSLARTIFWNSTSPIRGGRTPSERSQSLVIMQESIVLYKTVFTLIPDSVILLFVFRYTLHSDLNFYLYSYLFILN